MNKKIRNIVLMAAALAVIIGANIWLKNIIENKADDNVEDNRIIYISNYSVGSVQKIEIENQFGKVTLLQQNEVWYAEGMEDVELDQGVVSEFAYTLTHITGERVVSDTNDTTNLYGMLSPTATITTYHEGAFKQSFIIGNKAPVENEYYLESSVFNKVYTVDSAYYAYGQIKIEDLMLLNEISIEHADMKKLDITNAYGEKFTIQRTSDDNDISLCYWEFIEPFNHDIDTAVMYGTSEYDGMITYITQLSAESVIGNIQKDSDAYYCDNPIFSCDIYTYDNQMQGFIIYDYGDAENYAIVFSDDSNIYSVSKDRVPFANYSAYMLAESNLDLINIDAVDKITINMPDIETFVDIEHVASKNEDGTEVTDANGNTVYDIIINVDGLAEETVGASNIYQQKIWFYQDIVTIKIDGLYLDCPAVGDKIGSIVFDLNSKRRDIYTIEFYKYSQSHYIAKKNNEEVGYLINKQQINDLVKRYGLLLEGQLESDY